MSTDSDAKPLVSDAPPAVDTANPTSSAVDEEASEPTAPSESPKSRPRSRSRSRSRSRAKSQANATADSTDSATDSSKTKSSSRRRKSRSVRRLEREQRLSRNLKIALAVVLLALTTIVVVGSKTQNHLIDQNNKLHKEMGQLKYKAKQAEAEAEQLREDLSALLEQRLPGLIKLAFDEVIPLNDDYVKHVIMALNHDNGRSSYEYRFALVNSQMTPVLPKFSLYLFDANGIQVGYADVTETGQASEGAVRALGPNERRTYSGSTTLIEGAKPAYLMLNLR